AAEIAALKGTPEPRPFLEGRDARADVADAFNRARTNGKRVLLILGSNECHDSRALIQTLARPDVARLLDARYERALVDVGPFRDRNADVARGFGVEMLTNTPTVLIATADGALLNRDSIIAWKDASQRTGEEAVVYFSRY
ncbi:MAG: thioredoxin family protein, partial [Parvularculaceae bacterium]|nr:thioredoxin family protein [Parvularculaceae bacterium]